VAQDAPQWKAMIMRRLSRRSRFLIPGAMTLAFLTGALPVSAATWVRTTLHQATGLALQDAAFNGHDEVVAWQQPGPVTKLRTSTNNGSSFGTTTTVEPGHQTRQASTALCGSDLYVAFAENFSQPSTPNLWLISIDTDTLAGVNRAYSAAYQTQDKIGRLPDVACTGQMLWVTWEQKVGSTWHVFVNRAARSFSSFDLSPIDLGRLGSEAGKPVIAATRKRVAVAWATPSGTIRIHRWSTGSGGVTDLGERQLGTGNPSGVGAGLPQIAALGSKLAVVWYDCGDMRARVSNDHGGTWGSVRTIFHGACGSEFGGLPSSVAIDGSRILVAYSWFQGIGNQRQRMISTTTDFAGKTDKLAYPASDLLLLGFVHPSGGSKIAGAVDEGTRLRALRRP
jgi:hypothetical protein